MALYNQVLPLFRQHDAQVIGISVDGSWCHSAFAKDRGTALSPCSRTFEPKGHTARSYGVYRADDGTSERALFVLDKEGVIRWKLCLASRGESRRRWYPPKHWNLSLAGGRHDSPGDQ